MKFTNNRNNERGMRKSRAKNPASRQSNRGAVVQELERLILKKAASRPKSAKKSGAKKSPVSHPLMKTVKGILSPFTAERGSFGGLMDPRPSQKFTARGLLSVSIPAGDEYIVMVAPCIASDTLTPSMILSQGTQANMSTVTSVYQSPTVANWPAGITQRYSTSATPYEKTLLGNGQNTWRLLSAGIRVRYTGPNLYRGGLVKHYHDSRGDMLNAAELTTLTFGDLTTRLDGHAGLIRHNLSDSPELQAVFPGITQDTQSWTGAQPYYWAGNREYNNQRMGGTTSAYTFGQPIGYLYGTNTTGQALYFDCEIVEHWEMAGRAVDALNSSSCGSADLGNSLATLAVAAHQHLAHNPSKTYHQALKVALRDPHVKAAFSGVGSSIVSSVVAML